MRLKRKHVERVDEIIRARHEQTASDARAQAAALGRGESAKPPPPINYSAERRRIVAELIENELGPSAREPTEIGIHIPPGPYNEADAEQIQRWARAQRPGLTLRAPKCVRTVLATNRLRQFKRELAPGAYLDRLQRATEE